jgi:hypothetical protein
MIPAASGDTVAAELVWLDLTKIARAELSSVDPSYPIESALNPAGGAGWQAAESGPQTLRLLFDEPLPIRHVHLEFHEDQRQRTQEFVLRCSLDSGRSWREIVRQQYNFSPPDSCREVEEYSVNLAGVTTLELGIIPEISGGDVRASLARLLLA